MSVQTSRQPVNQLDTSESRWFAVYTRYKREKLVNQRLSENDIQSYLPIQKVTRQYTRKIKHLRLPLISCYVFVKVSLKDYVRVLEDPDVVNFVKLRKDLIAIPEEEIELLKRIEGFEGEVMLDQSSFKPGDSVEVIGGQLTGLKGRLIESKGKNFQIALENIGYTMSMLIDRKYLRKL